MAIVECTICQKRGRYHPQTFRGSWWRPVRTLDCQFCGKEFDVQLVADVTNDQVKAELEEDNARSRSTDPRLWVGEYWVQVYLREKASTYRLDVIEPLRPTGPDFLLLHHGRPATMEVEVRWDDYLKHGHHLDERFHQQFPMLAVLHPPPPAPSLRPLLPADILYVRPDDFLSWKDGEGRQFAHEVAELEGGQHTSYEESRLAPHLRFALEVQRLSRRIQTNSVPDCLAARDELVVVLRERGDARADKLAALVLPMRSRLFGDDVIDPSLFRPRLAEDLDELFPERKQEISLRTVRRHYLRRAGPRRRKPLQ